MKEKFEALNFYRCHKPDELNFVFAPQIEEKENITEQQKKTLKMNSDLQEILQEDILNLGETYLKTPIDLELDQKLNNLRGSTPIEYTEYRRRRIQKQKE